MTVEIGALAAPTIGAFKIGPFGSSLRKSELAPSGIPVVGIENVLANRFVKGFARFVDERKFAELADYEIRPGDVLVTTMGTIGRAAVAPAGVSRSIIDSHLFRMRVDESKVLPAYLCYGINSQSVRLQLQRLSRGSIMDGLNTSVLKACIIPLPPLPEQRCIAARLAEAENLCRMRRYVLDLSQSFLRAAFLRMFRDPVTNEFGFDVRRLIDVIRPERPITYGILKPGPHVPGGVPYVRVTDIHDGSVLVHQVKRTTQSIDAAYKRSRLAEGDLLLSIRGQVGRMGVVPESLAGANITQDTARLSPTSDLTVPFLMGCLDSAGVQRIMERETRGLAVKGINLGDVKLLPVIVPPKPMQELYSKLAFHYQRLRAQQGESLRQSEHLFQTLLHHSFS